MFYFPCPFTEFVITLTPAFISSLRPKDIIYTILQIEHWQPFLSAYLMSVETRSIEQDNL